MVERDMADETTTGLGAGTQPTGQTIGGTLEAPDTTGIGGSTDTDTGLEFGPGQSTTTGTLPTQGRPNLEGPVDLDTSTTADVPRERTTAV